MNKVILMGRLTRDPDVRYTQGNEPLAVARFTVAVDRRRRAGEDSADFISCIAFGKQGEFVEKYLKKGTKIVLSGRIQTGSYTNKENEKVYTTDVVAEEIEFAESKKADGNTVSGIAPVPQTAPVSSETAQAMGDGFIPIPDEIDSDLPF